MSGTDTLDWPVAHGGTVVVRPGGETFTWCDGTGEDRRFPVASVTKLLTALAALTAVEAGHVSLDDGLPEGADLPEGVGSQPPAVGVTLRHLLAHASGLPQDPSARPRPPEHRRIYSNPGYRLAAAVVAHAVRLPFADWLDSSVLRPLGMRSTVLAARHGVPDDPAAGAVSTLPDLALLASCLLDRGAPVVGPKLFADATSVQYPGLAGLVPGVGRFDPCDWGLGPELKGAKDPHWMGQRRSAASFGHFGASGCFVWVDPAAGVAAAAVTERAFDDDRWAMRTWPSWSDQVGEEP